MPKVLAVILVCLAVLDCDRLSYSMNFFRPMRSAADREFPA